MRLPLSFLLLLIPASLAGKCLTGYMPYTDEGEPQTQSIQCDAETCLVESEISTRRLIFSCGTEDKCAEEPCSFSADGNAKCCCKGDDCNIFPTPATQKILREFRESKNKKKHKEDEEEHKDKKEEEEHNDAQEQAQGSRHEWMDREIERLEKIVAAQEPDPIPQLPKIPEVQYVPLPHEEKKPEERHGEGRQGGEIPERNVPAGAWWSTDSEKPNSVWVQDGVVPPRNRTCFWGRTLDANPFRMIRQNRSSLVVCSNACSRTISKLNGEVWAWTFGCAPTEDFCTGKPKCSKIYKGEAKDCCCGKTLCNDFHKGPETKDLSKQLPRLERLQKILKDLKEALQEVDLGQISEASGEKLNQREQEAFDYGKAIQFLAESRAGTGIQDEHQLKNYITKEGKKELMREFYTDYVKKRRFHEQQGEKENGGWVKEKEEPSGWSKAAEYAGKVAEKAASLFQIPSKWINKD